MANHPREHGGAALDDACVGYKVAFLTPDLNAHAFTNNAGFAADRDNFVLFHVLDEHVTRHSEHAFRSRTNREAGRKPTFGHGHLRGKDSALAGQRRKLGQVLYLCELVQDQAIRYSRTGWRFVCPQSAIPIPGPYPYFGSAVA